MFNPCVGGLIGQLQFIVHAFKDLTILFSRKLFRKRIFIVNKYKWYHRHGYWATRKKKIDFDKWRPYRYNEVKGSGKKPRMFWQEESYYKPLRNALRFW
ncbi:conserved Plasmodium protein, unknown function [Babesia microti strain RI]|uniref:Uncharacterized protein n=1 Tax=Babesia microti (strain RI) TaxID=1133968 RepID=A0A0K3AUP3_BABMR|nr:conserved Plasmodium protein, unknown function [Babesia microti strain RI]CTQ41316.1 conserved Plasmodium protein, unknown function [Babesia microti strain RI]|eukprot:XP_012649327.1 conserved Plasmodium protein, unknown function [Babesia microti strain RI]